MVAPAVTEYSGCRRSILRETDGVPPASCVAVLRSENPEKREPLESRIDLFQVFLVPVIQVFIEQMLGKPCSSHGPHAPEGPSTDR